MKAIDNKEEKEDKGNNEKEKKSDEQSGDESGITSNGIRQENDAYESDNLLESEDSDEDVRDKGLPIASLFEEAEEDGEQVMQRVNTRKFEEEQKSDESLKAWWKLAEDKQSEFCVVNGLLYKKHRIKSFIRWYWERRGDGISTRLKLGGHLREEIIKLSFVWPKMRREIDKFCKSCE